MKQKTLPASILILLLFFNAASIFAQTSWKGITSTNWATATNWTGGVPSATTNVIIGDANFTGAFQPAISASSAALSLTIGGTVTAQLTVASTLAVKGDIKLNANGTLVNGAASISLTGNWVNGGTYTTTSTSATIIFNGTAQTLGGTVPTTFRKLAINTGSVLTLASNATATGASSAVTVGGTLNPAEAPVYVLTADSLAVSSAGVLKVTAAVFAGNYVISKPVNLVAGSIVEYAATLINQTIASTFLYSTLRISGVGSVKGLAADVPALRSTSSSVGNIYVLSGTLDIGGFLVNRGTTVAGGTFSVSNGAFFKVGGTSSFPTSYSSNTLSLTSTVEYNGTNQLVAAKTYGNLVLSSGSGAAVKSLTVTTFTVAGNLTSMVGAGTSVTFAAAAIIAVTGNVNIGAGTTFDGGAFAHPITGNWVNNGTFTASSSTINLKGASTTISGSATQNFYNLTITGSNISAPGVTALNISGNLATTGSGGFTQAAGLLTMPGTTKTWTGINFILNNVSITGIVTTTATGIIAGDINVSGSLVASSGIFTMSGTSKTITNTGTLTLRELVVSGTVTTASNFNIATSLNTSGTFTATAGTVTIAASTLLSGTANLFNIAIANTVALTLAGNAVMGIAGTLTYTTGSINVTTNIPNTINYNGAAAQTIKGVAYNNLILSNGFTKTAGAAITVNNAFTIAPTTTFDAAAFSHVMLGNWVNNGTFTASTSTIQFTGTANTTIAGASTFNIITVNKSAVTNTVTLLSNVSVATINMTQGNLYTGSNAITITVNRLGGTGIILGTITRTHAFVAGTAYAFEGPLNTITFASVSGVTSITVNVALGNVADFPFNGAIGRVYTITVPAGTYNAKLSLHYEDAELNGNVENSMQLWRYNGAAWGVSGKTNNLATTNFVEKSGLTDITSRWSLTDDGSVLNWTGSVSSDWSNGANWSLVQGTFSGAPSSTDIAQIGIAAFASQPVITTAAIAKSITLGSAQAVALNLNAGGSLTVNGNINGTWSTGAVHTINANNQALAVNGDLALSDNTIGHTINLNIGTGTVTITGSLTEAGDANINFTGAGTLNIGADFIYTGGTFTRGTGLVKYTGTASQAVAGLPYNNLTIIKSAATIATLNTAGSVSGALIITTGELDVRNTLTVAGAITISAGATLDGNANTINVGGNWVKAATGVFNAGNGIVRFNGTGAQSISAGAFNTLYFNKAAGTVATLLGDNTVSGDLSLLSGTVSLGIYTLNQSSAGDVFTVADGTALQVGGSNNFPSGFSTYAIGTNSLVQYNGTVAQSVADIAYGNITFSLGGAAEKTLIGNCTINGNITISNGASFNSGNFVITLNGNWVNAGTFTAGTGDMLLNGISKTLAGNTTFGDFTVNGSYAVANSDMSFNGQFVVTSTGSYVAGTGVATVNGDLTNSGSLSSAGTTTFSGTALQTMHLINALVSTSTGIVNFNGNISPIFNSTSPPIFATLNINNTAGVSPSVGWYVLVAFNIGSGAAFYGGVSTHICSGSFTNNGTVTSSGTLNFNPPSAVTLKLSGTAFSSTGTVIFGGSGAVAITGTPTALQDVIIANTNAAGITAPSAWAVNGNLSINSNAIFNAGSYAHVVAGDIESDGALNGNTSTITMTGASADLSGSPATVFHHFTITGNIASNSDFNVDGDFVNNGSFDGSLGAVNMVGSNAASIGGTTSPSTIAQLTVSKTSGAVVTQNVNVNAITALIINSGTLFTSTYTLAPSGSGGVMVIQGGATLKLGGTNTLPAFNGYALDVQSTVEYAGTAQSLANGAIYGNLLISASGNKTAASFFPLTVAGNFTITDGNFIANNNTHRIGGNWVMTGGTFTSTNSVIQFNGLTAQDISTTSAFNSLQVNKASGVVTFSNDVTVNSILTFTKGIIQTGAYTIILPAAASVAGFGQTTGWVNGNLQKNVATGTSVVRQFEVGDTTHFSPAIVTFASVTTSGSLKATAVAAEHPQVDFSGISNTLDVNRYWKFTNTGTAFTTANATLNWVATDNDAGITAANLKPVLYNGSAWAFSTSTAPSATSIQATGLTSFGALVVGEKLAIATWTGAGGTADWFSPSNWYGGVPSINMETLIPATLMPGRFFPVIGAGTASIDSVSIQASGVLTVTGGKLQIKGAINNAGSFDAEAGTIEMNGVVPQTIPANTFVNNNVQNLIISNNVSLGGQQNITGTLSFGGSSKTLTTGDNLVFRSTALGTARLADITNGGANSGNLIAGKATIERYIPAKRSWRLLSAPVGSSGTPTINTSWQESVTSGNPNVGYGTQITGGTIANGFDQGINTNPSLKIYNNATNTFVGLPAVPGTNALTTAYPGYFLFLRGDRGTNLLQGVNAAISPTTLRIKGQVLTGNMVTTVNAHNMTLVGNPFPSAIDFHSLTKSNVNDKIYIWDPKLAGSAGYGGYVTLVWNGGSYDATTSVSPVSRYIPSGEAFFVESQDGTNSGTLTVKETDKSTGGSDFTFRPMGTSQKLRVNLFSVNSDGSGSLSDGVLTTYNDDNENAVDGNDAKKLYNLAENITIGRDSKMLAIERRHSIEANDTTFLNLYTLKQQQYKLQVTAEGMENRGLYAVIKDKYSADNNNKMVNIGGVTDIVFTVNADPASYAADRFSIVFAKASPLPVTFTSVKAYRKQKNIQVEWATASELNVKNYEVETSANGNTFKAINSTLAKTNNGSSAAYNWLDAAATNAIQYYRIKSVDADGKTSYSTVVKVAAELISTLPNIVVAGNSFTANSITVQLNNMDKGTYSLELFTIEGQLEKTFSIEHSGGNGSHEVSIGKYLAAGKYELHLSGKGINLSAAIIKK